MVHSLTSTKNGIEIQRQASQRAGRLRKVMLDNSKTATFNTTLQNDSC